MCLIVLGSSHYQCNPDNISTPIAASLGDSITLGILSLVGSVLFHIPGQASALKLNNYYFVDISFLYSRLHFY